MEDRRSKLEDLLDRAFRTGRPCVSEFSTAERMEEFRLKGDYLLLGGHPNAERALFCALPSAGFRVREEDFLAALWIVPNDGAKYAHRDYLGSLLALGIKRESVGDIVLAEDGAGRGCAYAVVTPPMAKYIRENLSSVSRTGAKCLAVPLSEVPANRREPEELLCSVSSLRLDCVLSAVFGMARGDAKALCERGACFVNLHPAEKAEKLLAEGDFVTLKGWGRFRVNGQAGVSKKGKLRLSVSKDA